MPKKRIKKFISFHFGYLDFKRSGLRVSNSKVFSSGYLIHVLIPDDDNHVAQNEKILDLRDEISK